VIQNLIHMPARVTWWPAAVSPAFQEILVQRPPTLLLQGGDTIVKTISTGDVCESMSGALQAPRFVSFAMHHAVAVRAQWHKAGCGVWNLHGL